MVAADASTPERPQLAEHPIIGTASPAATGSAKPDAAHMSKGTLEVAPLPPARPKTLASTEPSALARAKPSDAKPSDAKANADGASSFAIQVASSPSKRDAVEILSRLKKQFPDMLGNGSVHKADGDRTGVHYRVQAGPLSRQAANKACSRLKASGENCIVVRG